MPDTRLRKEERIKSRKQIDALFNEGHSIRSYPVRLVWMLVTRDHPFAARVAFSVPRRTWKRAVDRNLLKRRMREAYRFHKHLLFDPDAPSNQPSFLIACLYNSDVICTYDKIEEGMKKCLARIADQRRNPSK